MNRLRSGSDDGLSLAELLVAMALASILMLAMGTMFVSSLRENRTVVAKTNSTGDARIGMEAMTRALRVASVPSGQPAAVSAASATSVTFYSSLGTSTATTDPKPTLVTFAIDTAKRCLRRDVTPATLTGTTLSWPAANKVSKCVARGDINTSGADLFTYYPLNPDGTLSSTPIASSALSSSLDDIVAVGLNLSVTDTANTTINPTTIQDQVTLVNVMTALQGASS